MPKKTYVPAPTVPGELAERYRLVLLTRAGGLPVSEAARQAGLARNHFQSVVHRAQTALIEALTDRPPGRPPKPQAQAELEQTVARLTRENEKLTERLETFERLLGVAGGLLRGEWKTVRRKAKGASPPGTSAEPTAKAVTNDDDEPPQPLELVADLRASGVSLALAAMVAGVSAATVRRRARKLVVSTTPAAQLLQLPAAAVEGTRAIERVHLARSEGSVHRSSG